jgi:hypothetical protein
VAPVSTEEFPYYIDLDPEIDVTHLRALDQFLTSKLEARSRKTSGDTLFYTGPFLLHSGASNVPGSRMVYLTRSCREDSYYDLDRPELWERTEEAAEFAPLMAFIDTLPFAATGRMIVMYDPVGREVPAHCDHDRADIRHEFVWFRTNFAKPFYMLNPATSEKLYVRSHAAWFDTVNQFHGADASHAPSFSVRVDGIFTDEFRQRLAAHAAHGLVP